MIVAMLVMGFTAAAQERMVDVRPVPGVQVRQVAQRARIHQGVQSGDITRMERRMLLANQRHIRRSARRVRANGEVTSGERLRLQHKQDNASRRIRRARLNTVE